MQFVVAEEAALNSRLMSVLKQTFAALRDSETGGFNPLNPPLDPPLPSYRFSVKVRQGSERFTWSELSLASLANQTPSGKGESLVTFA